jgi:hypothetical protein
MWVLQCRDRLRPGPEGRARFRSPAILQPADRERACCSGARPPCCADGPRARRERWNPGLNSRSPQPRQSGNPPCSAFGWRTRRYFGGQPIRRPGVLVSVLPDEGGGGRGGLHRTSGGDVQRQARLPARPDVCLREVDPARFHALLIPGGYSPDHMRRVPAMVSLVEDMHVQGKVVAAICHAGWMLASADIVRGGP